MERPVTIARYNSKVMVDYERRIKLRNWKVEQGISLYNWTIYGHELKGENRKPVK